MLFAVHCCLPLSNFAFLNIVNVSNHFPNWHKKNALACNELVKNKLIHNHISSTHSANRLERTYFLLSLVSFQSPTRWSNILVSVLIWAINQLEREFRSFEACQRKLEKLKAGLENGQPTFGRTTKCRAIFFPGQDHTCSVSTKGFPCHWYN